MLPRKSKYSLRVSPLTMIVKGAGSVEGRRTGGRGPRRGTVRPPTSLLMVDLTVIDVPDHVDLLVLGLMSMLPFLHGVRSLMYRVRYLLLQKSSDRRVLLLLLLIVHAIRPRIGLPFFRHKTPRHDGDVVPPLFCSRHQQMITMLVVVRSTRTTTRTISGRDTHAIHQHRHAHQQPQYQPHNRRRHNRRPRLRRARCWLLCHGRCRRRRRHRDVDVYVAPVRRPARPSVTAACWTGG